MPPPAEGFAARLVLGPALRTQPDRRLVTLVREGYENAFEEIVRRYGKPLTRYAAAIVGSRAEDVTQDAFSKALLALRREGAEIELRPWLFRIVRNTALNDLRDRPPSAAVLAEAIAGGGNPAEELERREELADLMSRLHSLPEAQRAAIVMRELEGLSHDEIAAALGLSGGAARQAIYRARRALRDSAGLLLPLPLLKTLLAGAASAPLDAGAGAAGLGGAAGAGVALKAATATVLLAGAVGAGVAIDHGRQDTQPERASAHSVAAPDSPTRTAAAKPPASIGTEVTGEQSGPDSGQGEAPGGKAGGSPGEVVASHGGEEGGWHEGGGGSSGGAHQDGEDHSTAGSGHGGSSGPSGPGDSEGDGGHQAGGNTGSSGPGDGSGGGLDDNSGLGNESTSSSSDSGSDGGSDSNSGPDSGDGGGGSGDDNPLDGSGSGGSSDSHSGDGFTQQPEPQTQEEP